MHLRRLRSFATSPEQVSACDCDCEKLYTERHCLAWSFSPLCQKQPCVPAVLYLLCCLVYLPIHMAKGISIPTPSHLGICTRVGMRVPLKATSSLYDLGSCQRGKEHVRKSYVMFFDSFLLVCRPECTLSTYSSSEPKKFKKADICLLGSIRLSDQIMFVSVIPDMQFAPYYYVHNPS